VAEHGIAVVALMDQVHLASANVYLQCECGWRMKLGEVTTDEAVAREAAGHRRVAGGDGG
jgi:hypothetical protein